MRDLIWRFARRNHKEGEFLPWYLFALKCVLHPLEFLFYLSGLNNGYQIETDTWIINGITYGADFFLMMARADGEVYRMRRKDDTVEITQLIEYYGEEDDG